MCQNSLRDIVRLIREAQSIAGNINLLQPGLIKEMVIADALGHVITPTKHFQDAESKDKSEKYEYLTCVDGGSFQIDRVFKSPIEKRQKSLKRITRNKKIFCVSFDKEVPLKIKEIFDVPVPLFLAEVERQLDGSQNEISHIGVTMKWVRMNGTMVYPSGREG